MRLIAQRESLARLGLSQVSFYLLPSFDPSAGLVRPFFWCGWLSFCVIALCVELLSTFYPLLPPGTIGVVGVGIVGVVGSGGAGVKAGAVGC